MDRNHQGLPTPPGSGKMDPTNMSVEPYSPFTLDSNSGNIFESNDLSPRSSTTSAPRRSSTTSGPFLTSSTNPFRRRSIQQLPPPTNPFTCPLPSPSTSTSSIPPVLESTPSPQDLSTTSPTGVRDRTKKHGPWCRLKHTISGSKKKEKKALQRARAAQWTKTEIEEFLKTNRPMERSRTGELIEPGTGRGTVEVSSPARRPTIIEAAADGAYNSMRVVPETAPPTEMDATPAARKAKVAFNETITNDDSSGSGSAPRQQTAEQQLFRSASGGSSRRYNGTAGWLG